MAETESSATIGTEIPFVTEREGYSFNCQEKDCGEGLHIPEEVIEEIKNGDEVILYCVYCHHCTIIEHGKSCDIPMPPRATTRWTETYY
ncbi:MAG: hypothetical protein K0S20_575 [Patescibacteria group bacterium]|nr:hypothetical protein [Patescibacteria group bacterium]